MKNLQFFWLILNFRVDDCSLPLKLRSLLQILLVRYLWYYGKNCNPVIIKLDKNALLMEGTSVQIPVGFQSMKNATAFSDYLVLIRQTLTSQN